MRSMGAAAVFETAAETPPTVMMVSAPYFEGSNQLRHSRFQEQRWLSGLFGEGVI